MKNPLSDELARTRTELATPAAFLEYLETSLDFQRGREAALEADLERAEREHAHAGGAALLAGKALPTPPASLIQLRESEAATEALVRALEAARQETRKELAAEAVEEFHRRAKLHTDARKALARHGRSLVTMGLQFLADATKVSLVTEDITAEPEPRLAASEGALEAAMTAAANLGADLNGLNAVYHAASGPTRNVLTNEEAREAFLTGRELAAKEK